ncbi:putative ribonuclease H-like domain-containing protein [Tanacetum coccineum]
MCPLGIENLIDLKVKVIRCDNGTEFKNRVMNQFFEMKGIKREFSVARTPQQNGVAKRKNRTLIEAARTMLADSKLPTTFWAKAVNTACYAQNRMLVIKPHNKTPYELFLGEKPALSFMRPFGCPVTILNTIDHLGTKSCDDAGKDSVVPSTEEPREDQRVNQENDASVKSTNTINSISPTVNAAGIEDNDVDENIVYGCANDPNMPELEDIVYSDDDEDVGIEADMNNLNTFMPVSPIPTTRIHKDHLVEQIIRDLHSAPQTRRMTKYLEEHDLPNGKRAIGTKWIYRNKKDERDNGFQRGKIDKTLFIRRDKGDILLVQVYVDDITFGSTKKSLCTEFEKMTHKKFQMSSMGELTFFLGLQVKQKEDGIFISQDKYVTEILKKFGFTDVKTASTPMKTQKPLLKDEDGEDVDVHLYRSMIGSLMYLTSSRPDIMFADSPFDLVTYTDSDYAGASLDRKSTTGGCQFLGCRLISWQCKKQTVVANSTTEDEYIAASNCYGQDVWNGMKKLLRMKLE